VPRDHGVRFAWISSNPLAGNCSDWRRVAPIRSLVEWAATEWNIKIKQATAIGAKTAHPHFVQVGSWPLSLKTVSATFAAGVVCGAGALTALAPTTVSETGEPDVGRRDKSPPIVSAIAIPCKEQVWPIMDRRCMRWIAESWTCGHQRRCRAKRHGERGARRRARGRRAPGGRQGGTPGAAFASRIWCGRSPDRKRVTPLPRRPTGRLSRSGHSTERLAARLRWRAAAIVIATIETTGTVGTYACRAYRDEGYRNYRDAGDRGRRQMTGA